MIDKMDIYAFLKDNGEAEEGDTKRILSCCERAAVCLTPKIKDDVKHDDPRVIEAASAVARFFLSSLDDNPPSGFKVGDITVKKENSDGYKRQKERLELSMALAAPILKDGGFGFVSV